MKFKLEVDVCSGDICITTYGNLVRVLWELSDKLKRDHKTNEDLTLRFEQPATILGIQVGTWRIEP